MSQTTQEHAAATLNTVRSRINAAARRAQRAPADVTLIAVSKTFAAADITPVLAAGQRVFGENRVQEAVQKWPPLQARYDGVKLHLIGPLQTNKVKDAVAVFDAIHAVDRPKLARALAAEMARQGRTPQLFIQINTGEEPQKAGVMPAEAPAFIAQCRDDLGLPIAGLMCIPPVAENAALHFALLAQLAQRTGVRGLSMGMSADYETAIALGATHVRVGSAIFGPRVPH